MRWLDLQRKLILTSALIIGNNGKDRKSKIICFTEHKNYVEIK